MGKVIIKDIDDIIDFALFDFTNLFNSRMTKTENDEKDLRQECLQILKNHHPAKNLKPWLKQMSPPPLIFDAAKAKADFETRNEAYVQSLRKVLQVGKNAAIKRNIKATEQL